MKIMNLLVTSAFMVKPLLVPILAMKMVDFTIEHGACSFTSVAFAVYGMMLCGSQWRVEEGYEFGQLALRMLEKYKLKEFLPRVYCCVYGQIRGFTRPMRDCLGLLRRSIDVAMETGDIEFAMLISNLYCGSSFFSGRDLPSVAADIQGIRQNLTAFNQKSLMNLQIPFLFTVKALMGSMRFGEIERTNGSFNEEDFPNQQYPVAWLAGQKCMVAYYFKDYEKAAGHASEFLDIGDTPFKAIDFVSIATFAALSLLAIYRRSSRRSRSDILKKVRYCLKFVNKAAKHAPVYCLNKSYLLKAELAVILNKPYDAHGHYTSAIALAAKDGRLGDEAIANERAGRFMLEGGGKRPCAAIGYFEEALAAYRRWGAAAKAQQFEVEVEKLKQNPVGF